ncbi:MAG: SGNH/GDSL hydrolase family protein [Pseudomonadota bacterium]
MRIKLLKTVIFWTLFPFVLPQAMWVRKSAPRFKDADGERFGIVGEGRPLKLVAIGDSIIAGVGATMMDKALVGQTACSLADQMHTSVQWKAVGKTGITSAGVVRKLVPQLPKDAPEFMIVSVGVNDVTSLTTIQAWTENLHALLSELHQYAPDAVIAFAGLPPLGRFPLLPQPLRTLLGWRAQLLDQAAAEVIQNHHYAVDVPLSFDLQPENFSADGYHPNEDSYIEYGRLMAEALISKKKA